MRRSTALFLTLAALAACALTACGAGTPNWREYAYPEKEFAVSFPAEPNVDHPVWSGHPGFTAELVGSAHNYGVVVIDAEGYDNRVDYVLQGGAQKLAQAVGGAVKAVGYDTSRDGVPGLRVVIARPGQADVTGRLFYYHSRLYEVGDFRPSAPNDPDSERFLASFHFMQTEL
jgi:hypothetical protein